MPTFITTLELVGTTATGFRVPAEVVEVLAAGERPPVHVTVNGHTFRATIAHRDGHAHLRLSRQLRRAIGTEPGERITVTLVHDSTAAVVTPPPELAAALAGDDVARATWDTLAPSHRESYSRWITDATAGAVRQRRAARAAAMLRVGQSTR